MSPARQLAHLKPISSSPYLRQASNCSGVTNSLTGRWLGVGCRYWPKVTMSTPAQARQAQETYGKPRSTAAELSGPAAAGQRGTVLERRQEQGGWPASRRSSRVSTTSSWVSPRPSMMEDLVSTPHALASRSTPRDCAYPALGSLTRLCAQLQLSCQPREACAGLEQALLTALRRGHSVVDSRCVEPSASSGHCPPWVSGHSTLPDGGSLACATEQACSVLPDYDLDADCAQVAAARTCSPATVSMLCAKTSSPEVARLRTAAASPLKSGVRHSTSV